MTVIREVALHGGTQIIHRFDNGYGASVVRHEFSYGGPQGFWELAVLRFKPGAEDGSLTYSTPITSDVLGHLTDDEVAEALGQIEQLPEAPQEDE
jgi:hypothetical protein